MTSNRGSRTVIALCPAVLQWARERANLAVENLAEKMKVAPEQVSEWERTGVISFARTDRLAQKTHTPLGLLYLSVPPDERLPIPDFRTRSSGPLPRPSPDLLEIIGDMLRRQDWMREELVETDGEPLPFVGSHATDDDPLDIAATIRQALHLSDGWASSTTSWEEALATLRDHAEKAGVLVVFNGVVGNDTSRPLDPEEFQGFALSDAHAPLVFVNNSDFKAAQMFTLAHELAHLAIGRSGVSGSEEFDSGHHAEERSCNRAAAEFLVPNEELTAYWPEARRQSDPIREVARRFRVSRIVAAWRVLDIGKIDREEFSNLYRMYRTGAKAAAGSARGGGDFWKTQKWRIGVRFGEAVMRAVKEGRLLYRDAYSLTGLSGDTFNNMPEKMALRV